MWQELSKDDFLKELKNLKISKKEKQCINDIIDEIINSINHYINGNDNLFNFILNIKELTEDLEKHPQVLNAMSNIVEKQFK